jgi:outer membrane PBP1 activator LpoA protein
LAIPRFHERNVDKQHRRVRAITSTLNAAKRCDKSMVRRRLQIAKSQLALATGELARCKERNALLHTPACRPLSEAIVAFGITAYGRRQGWEGTMMELSCVNQRSELGVC